MTDPIAALVAIQELHGAVPESPMRHWVSCKECAPGTLFPCATRRLADDALTTHTNKNGDDK